MHGCTYFYSTLQVCKYIVAKKKNCNNLINLNMLLCMVQYDFKLEEHLF